MKKFLLLLLFALPIMAMGQTNESQTIEELRLIEKIYYDRDVYIASDEERDRLKDLVFEMRADSTLKVHIVGLSDKWGGKEVNDRFSYVRAMYIADWMRSCRVPREQIVFVGEGIDSLAANDAEARRVEISQVVEVVVEPTSQPQEDIIEAAKEEPITEVIEPTKPADTEDVIVAKPIEEIDTEMQVDPEPSAKTEITIEPQPTTEPQPSPEPHSPRFLAVKSNLLQLGVGVFNGGLEYGFTNKFSVDLPISYSPYTILKKWRIRTLMVQPEFRYWLDKPFSGHFFGAHAHTGYFNISTDKQDRYQNSPERPLWGCGVSYGYAMNLYKGLKVEFNLGVGYANIKYDAFYNIDNGAVYDLNQQRDYWGITRAGVSLIYMFNLK